MREWRPIGFIIEVFEEFSRDGCDALAGSLAFFTLFSFPPLLAVIVDTVALFTGTAKAVSKVEAVVDELFGAAVTEQILSVLESVQNTHHEGPGRFLGIVLAVFSASVVLAQAQRALNRVWCVDSSGGVEGFLLKRVVGLVLTLGFTLLMLVSMIASASLSMLGDRLDPLLPDGLSTFTVHFLTDVLAFLLLGVATTLLHKLLPERKIRTADAVVGGVVTATLLTVGQMVISWLLNTIGMGSAYGTAQSLALLLFWVFYGSAIFLWGAEFIKVWARRRGVEIVPSEPEHSFKRLASRARRVRFRRRR